MFGALTRLLGRAGHAVANDARNGANAISRTPIVRALESINPLIPQTALSPESLRPNQEAESYQTPYNVNGRQQNVGWMPHYPAYNIQGPKMPELLNQPDWTAYPPLNPDNYTPQYDVPHQPAGPWSPTAHLLAPGISPSPWTPTGGEAPLYKI